MQNCQFSAALVTSRHTDCQSPATNRYLLTYYLSRYLQVPRPQRIELNWYLALGVHRLQSAGTVPGPPPRRQVLLSPSGSEPPHPSISKNNQELALKRYACLSYLFSSTPTAQLASSAISSRPEAASLGQSARLSDPLLPADSPRAVFLPSPSLCRPAQCHSFTHTPPPTASWFLTSFSLLQSWSSSFPQRTHRFRNEVAFRMHSAPRPD